MSLYYKIFIRIICSFGVPIYRVAAHLISFVGVRRGGKNAADKQKKLFENRDEYIIVH